RNIELHETLAVADGFTVDVPHFDFPAAARIADINLLIVRRKTDPVGAAVGSAQLVRDLFDLRCLSIDAINAGRQFRIGLEAFVVAANAIHRIGEPDAAVGVNYNVIRRIQTLALKLFRDDRYRPVRLIPDDTPAAMLA